MPQTIQGISSMATKPVLAELAAQYGQRTGEQVAMASIGGVDAARRVEAGEPFDVVVLAADAIARLEAAGKVLAGSKVDLVVSGVAIAVPAGADQPDVGTEEALRQAVLAAPTLGYSTGPSGVALVKLFERWGIADEIAPRIVQAPPGVPVGSLVAQGTVALGFQQLSELMHLPGIAIVGGMPKEVEIVTTFSGAVCATSTQPDAVRRLLAFMASPEAADAKRRNGMDPA